MTPPHVDLKSHSLAVMRSAREICAFDLAGRMISYYDGEAHYWRGLSGIVIKRWTDASGEKQVEVLAGDRALEVLDRALDVLRGVRNGEAVRRIINRALSYDPAADRQAFERVYGKVGILPPDQYLCALVQVATGCAWNRCTFCDFYRDQRYHRRTVEEFRDHVCAVRSFLGDSVLLRRSIFLGDADALVVEHRTLAQMMIAARDALGLKDFFAFAEAVSVARRSPDELAELASLGLKRIYIGAESGSDAVLSEFDKRSRCSDVLAAVPALKRAGIQAGLIFLVGVGRESHVAETLDLIGRLPLVRGDLVYLSRLWGGDGKQMSQLLDGLAYLKRQGVKVAPYDIRQFVY